MSQSENIEPIWYAFRHGEYKGDLPAFYDPKMFPWVADFESHFPKFKEEIEQYLENENTPMVPYFNTDMVEDAASWKISKFRMWGRDDNENSAKVPKLNKFLNEIPDYVSASISLLRHGSEIPVHQGDTNAIVRCHFGLRIPAGLPECGLEVDGQQRAWEEGKALLFCDAHKHRAFNRSETDRYILIVDVLHPYYRSKRKQICSNILSVFWLQKLLVKMKFLHAAPGFVKGGIRVFCKVLIQLFAPPK